MEKNQKLVTSILIISTLIVGILIALGKINNYLALMIPLIVFCIFVFVSVVGIIIYKLIKPLWQSKI